MTDNGQALLAAAYRVASDQAAGYQYSQAIQTLKPHLSAATTTHPDLLIIRANLASWVGEAGRLEEAITAFGQLLDDRMRVLGPDHPNTLSTRNNLAYRLNAAGRTEEAAAVLRESGLERRRE